MKAHEFQNVLRILNSIEHDDLAVAGVLDGSERAWIAWTNDPYSQVMKMGDERTAKLWPLVEARTKKPAPVDRDQLIAHLTAEFGDSYDCARVWEAWDVGTMTDDDFKAVTNRIEEIADGLLPLLTAYQPPNQTFISINGPLSAVDLARLQAAWGSKVPMVLEDART